MRQPGIEVRSRRPGCQSSRQQSRRSRDEGVGLSRRCNLHGSSPTHTGSKRTKTTQTYISQCCSIVWESRGHQAKLSRRASPCEVLHKIAQKHASRPPRASGRRSRCSSRLWFSVWQKEPKCSFRHVSRMPALKHEHFKVGFGRVVRYLVRDLPVEPRRF